MSARQDTEYDVLPADLRSGDAQTQICVIVALAFSPDARPDQVAGVKKFLAESPQVAFSAEGIGAFHLVIEIFAPSPHSYTDWVRSLERLSEKLLTRKEEMFVCGSCHRKRADQVIWVSDGAGKRALPCVSLEKVIAERDYMHVYSGGRSWVVHATMRFFRELLCNDGFVQLNRSALVRSDTIERVGRIQQRWIAELRDGTEQFISKAHVASTLQQLGLRSSMGNDRSSSRKSLIEDSRPANETLLRVRQ
jgi:hypothetical protein